LVEGGFERVIVARGPPTDRFTRWTVAFLTRRHLERDAGAGSQVAKLDRRSNLEAVAGGGEILCRGRDSFIGRFG
jgi:hypothetical protein